MAFYKWALTEIGGFDPIFHHAGDDVDVCWRIQQVGYKIGFSPPALVWHYRRSIVGDYLKQQHGYGEAEALLVRKHPEYFNSFGASMWRGRIYSAFQFGPLLGQPIIYRGLFGSAGFQSLYAPTPPATMMLFTTPEYHLAVTMPLWILSVYSNYLLPLAIASLGISLTVCALAGLRAVLPKGKTRPWSRPLVALLFLLQPIVRGWARYQGRLLLGPTPVAAQQTLDSIAVRESKRSLKEASYWTDRPIDRLAFVGDLLRRLDHQGWPNKPDIGWSDYDVEIYGSRWSTLLLVTVAEDHGGGRQVVRCRLRPRWSFQARVAFWALAGFELLLLGFLAPRWHWLWFLLITLPLFAWFLRHDQRALQSMIIVFLDQLASDWKMIAVQGRRAKGQGAESTVQNPRAQIQTGQNEGS